MTYHSVDYDSIPSSCFYVCLHLLIAQCVRCRLFFPPENVFSVTSFKIEQNFDYATHSEASVGRWKMFHSLFSDRYNNKREMYYRRYESELEINFSIEYIYNLYRIRLDARERFPNLPLYRRPVEPTSNRKWPKRGHKKCRHSDYDYDEW